MFSNPTFGNNYLDVETAIESLPDELGDNKAAYIGTQRDCDECSNYNKLVCKTEGNVCKIQCGGDTKRDEADNVCILCQEAIPGCAKRDSDCNCVKCAPGYSKEGNSGCSKCQDSQSSDGEVCMDIEGCVIANRANYQKKCVKCDGWHKLSANNDGSCVDDCEDGYYNENGDGECEKIPGCVEGLKTQADKKCKTCETGYTLENGACVEASGANTLNGKAVLGVVLALAVLLW